MLRLKEKYSSKEALLIMGGPSILEGKLDLSRIDKERYVVFLETKALTPRFLELGIEPDYYIMCLPEKCKDNTLQSFIYRSFLAGTNIAPCLKPRFKHILKDMRENFNSYFELWKPERGLHKKFRWRPDVYMKDSPYGLLNRLPKETKIIVNRTLLEYYFPSFDYSRTSYFFELPSTIRPESILDVEKYYNPIERDGKLMLYVAGFLNSAAIAIYPLLYFMGFRKVYLLGMDMSIFGSMEYAAPYTFKSMLHFWWFFQRTKHVFNSNYISNRPFFFRPKSEFMDLGVVTGYDKFKFVRIYDKHKYTAPTPFIETISFDEFLSH